MAKCDGDRRRCLSRFTGLSSSPLIASCLHFQMFLARIEVFTLNSTGNSGWKHIPTSKEGQKDFSEVIAMICEPPMAIE